MSASILRIKTRCDTFEDGTVEPQESLDLSPGRRSLKEYDVEVLGSHKWGIVLPNLHSGPKNV